MDGVLLAGGLASRLGPITKVTNKHLLPIYDRPMIFHGIETLRDLGCDRIIIILGGNSVGDIVNLVRDGSQFDVAIRYVFQDHPSGIADAIYLARDIVSTSGSFKFLVLLGDNIFGDILALQESVDKWKKAFWDIDSPIMYPFAVFLASSDNPHEYGQPVFADEGMTITKFVEKDTSVDHNLVVTGLYGLNSDAFPIIGNQVFSDRREMEITDTLSAHLPHVLGFGYDGFWSDCGTPEGLLDAANFMRVKKEATWKQLETAKR